MLHKNLLIRLRSLSVLFAAVLFFSSAWAADQETVLYNFGNPPDAAGPLGSLLMDAAGNLYGASGGGGLYCSPYYDCGTVFKLSRTQGGGWTEVVLHSFGSGDDGSGPNGSLIMDAAGNLYGTTYSGIVFELSPNQNGTWTETVLYRFSGGDDGNDPAGGLVMDAAGKLYGTTNGGGAYGWGTVYELSHNGGGGWTETVLHSFNYSSNDGHSPTGNLAMDAAGNLYGTTYNGGQGGGFCQSNGCGTVFELSLGGGGWTETVLHSFDANDGYGPEAGLAMDAAGNLYGTTYQGGNLGGLVCAPFGCGTVFELSPVAGGGWTETTLYSFNGRPDAGYPQSNLILDAGGNLYGTTSMGGANNYGSAFELSPRHGVWTETVLDSFDAGGSPTGGLVMDRVGELYGLAEGGSNHNGVAYELTSPIICPAGCRSAER